MPWHWHEYGVRVSPIAPCGPALAIFRLFTFAVNIQVRYSDDTLPPVFVDLLNFVPFYLCTVNDFWI